MDSKLRLVTRIPLEELWRADGAYVGRRVRTLDSADVAELLRRGEVEFVVADVGKPLQWIAVNDCFSFWKNEVKPHLAGPDMKLRLDEFPGQYCYRASQWEIALSATPVFLLEKHH
jgi:hypothetical protein